MSKISEPFTTPRRNDSKTYQLTLNPTCGLPARICKEWCRKSFQSLPEELAEHRNPKNKAAAKIGAYALIAFLKIKQEKGNVSRISTKDITVGSWLEKFTAIETSPRTAMLASINRPYSEGTPVNYKSYFKVHIQGDPITELQMAELEESDVLEFISRLSRQKKKDGELMSGSRTHGGVIKFLRMAFRHYQRQFPRWLNPFFGLDAPRITYTERDTLTEEELLKLFFPGVLKTTMEFAVCACMFLSGLRRGEIGALRPEDLDFRTPRIIVRRAWQKYGSKDQVLGPTKGKKARDAPFDPILQEAIKKLWNEQGKCEWVFSVKGRSLGSKWILRRFSKWLKNAGIELDGREVVPHSARHSLASLLEERGVSLRYIQELLGHSDLKTTKKYLHSPESTIRKIGERISEFREEGMQKEEPEQKIVDFRVS